MKKIIFISLVACCFQVFRAEAQQQFMITQYMYNGLAMNPAYAGIHNGISASMLTRHQWVGIEGAPSTQFVSVHGPLRYKPISLGALIYRDVIGVKKEHTGYFSYAYRIGIVKDIKLSFGIQANFHQLNQNFLFDNTVDDGGDPLLANNNAFKFNSGAGLLLHSDVFYVGLSSPQLFKSKYGSRDFDTNSRLVRHYYITAGYAFVLPNDIVLKPNTLIKAVANAPAQIDLNMNILLKNILWLGISHRWKESNSLLAALQLGSQWQIGYAFDLNNNDLNRTSHEIMLNFIFDFPTSKVLTPRYF
ncbi:MAG: type IX secretion system membrane protein PorP/SprF [Cyclobacteriaceae bacterium]